MVKSTIHQDKWQAYKVSRDINKFHHLIMEIVKRFRTNLELRMGAAQTAAPKSTNPASRGEAGSKGKGRRRRIKSKNEGRSPSPEGISEKVDGINKT